MTDIWSKAPEGATHYGEKGDAKYFYRLPGKLGGNYDYWNLLTLDGPWRAGLGTPTTTILSERPAPSWNGEGLPPVGTVCELRTNIGGWGRAEIKYMSSTVCVWLWIRFDGGDQAVEWSEPPYKMEFRPIRTPEQIAADERMYGMADILKVSLGRIDAIGAAYLYDAGYRKSPERAK